MGHKNTAKQHTALPTMSNIQRALKCFSDAKKNQLITTQKIKKVAIFLGRPHAR